MSSWEPSIGATDEWYTPKYIFDALGELFDLDVAAPLHGPLHVPAKSYFSSDLNGLVQQWQGFVWMNPPFGGRNGLVPWLNRFFEHGDGIALTPDRTSAPWWQAANRRADGTLFIAGKIRFLKPDGTEGRSPGTGTTLFAAGERGRQALMSAQANGLRALMGVIAA